MLKAIIHRLFWRCNLFLSMNIHFQAFFLANRLVNQEVFPLCDLGPSIGALTAFSAFIVTYLYVQLFHKILVDMKN